MTTSAKKSQFLFVFRAPQDQPDPAPEEMQKIFASWMAWIQGLKDQGIHVAGKPLEDDGKVLRGPHGKSITDGPFVESKEIVGGFLIVLADNLDAATTIAKGLPWPGPRRRGRGPADPGSLPRHKMWWIVIARKPIGLTRQSIRNLHLPLSVWLYHQVFRMDCHVDPATAGSSRNDRLAPWLPRELYRLPHAGRTA